MAVSSAELTELFLRTAQRLRRSSMSELAPLGVTPAQVRALRAIASGDGPIRMGEIASRLGIVPRSATSLVDGLYEAGLIERSTDPTNRRSVLVSATPAAQTMLERLGQARRDAGDQLFGSLGDAERENLYALLSKALPADNPDAR